jgi:hypothetical protein
MAAKMTAGNARYAATVVVGHERRYRHVADAGTNSTLWSTTFEVPEPRAESVDWCSESM